MCVSPRIRPKPAQKGAERVKKNKGRSRFVALCVAPAVILFVIFMIVPTINVFRMSLFERGAYSPTETFVGLANFKALINDSLFIRSMQNTILLIVVVTMVTFAFALVFAGILTRENVKGKNIFRVIFYIPNILSVVVISGIFSAIYKPENGMLNSLLSMITGQTVTVLWKDAPLVMVSIIIAMVWQFSGYVAVIFLAAIKNVPTNIINAAKLDGAYMPRIYARMVIPQLKGAMGSCITILAMYALRSFDFIVSLVGYTTSSAWTLPVWMYNEAFQSNNFAYSAAISSFLLALVLVLILPLTYWTNRRK